MLVILKGPGPGSLSPIPWNSSQTYKKQESQALSNEFYYYSIISVLEAGYQTLNQK